jgi:hypothetical protein
LYLLAGCTTIWKPYCRRLGFHIKFNSKLDSNN